MPARKRLLIAVDGSPHALDGVRYVAHRCAPEHTEVQLLSVVPTGYEEVFWQVPMDEAFMADMKKRYEQSAAAVRRSAEDCLRSCRGMLVEAGYPGDRIGLSVCALRQGIARDILTEARQGYDAVVVGRRGAGKVESVPLGSVSNKIVQSLVDIPVGVVGGPISSRKILLAVDASANSAKAVAYAGTFLAGLDAELELLHVVRGFPPTLGPTFLHTGEELEEQVISKLKEGITRMFDGYRKVLESAGVSPERIVTAYTIGSTSRAADILSAARDGACGTVVMGRRGMSAVLDFIMGRVTNKVIQGAEGLAVWVVP